MRRRLHTALIVVAVVLAGCTGDDDDRGLEPIDTPTFTDEPADTLPPGSPGDAGSAGTDTPAASPSAAAPTTVAGAADDDGAAPTSAPIATTLPLERVAFDDPVGDATRGVGTSTPPGWTDLAGAALQRRGDAYRLEVRLGDTAPQRAPGSETMNIASFYDVDGDGDVDFEIWVNLDGNGWGPAWYDNAGGAEFGADSDVSVEVSGDTVALSFPAARLDAPDRLRFSIASEYGDLSVIGSSFARRDDAPDDDRAVSFP